MLARKYRKEPKDFEQFKKRFGWTEKNVSNLLSDGSYASRTNFLRDLGQKYILYFKNHPKKTHLFPMRSTIFHYEFAKGIARGYGIKPRIRTITTIRAGNSVKDYYAEHHKSQAKKLKLKSNQVIMHDIIQEGITKRAIEKASKGKVIANEFPPHYEFAQTVAPIYGKKELVEVDNMLRKKTTLLKTNTIPTYKIDKKEGLPKREHIFVRRAMYNAGIAIGKMIAEEERKAKQ